VSKNVIKINTATAARLDNCRHENNNCRVLERIQSKYYLTINLRRAK